MKFNGHSRAGISKGDMDSRVKSMPAPPPDRDKSVSRRLNLNKTSAGIDRTKLKPVRWEDKDFLRHVGPPKGPAVSKASFCLNSQTCKNAPSGAPRRTGPSTLVLSTPTGRDPIRSLVEKDCFPVIPAPLH